MAEPVPVALPTGEVLRNLAVAEGVCIRPILHEVTDTVSGETHRVPVACGATLASKCPPCAERHRKLRMQQCREGWHLEEEPPPRSYPRDDDHDDDDDEPTSRRHRSTRRRQDAPDLPRLPVANYTIGKTFTAKDGKVWRPSTFLTQTLDSYGKVRDDGTPVDPASYDYRRAALDALHLPKLFDRFAQNLRRAVGWDVQYFAVVEPQRRLAPHIHSALRGAIPRKTLRQVIAATYVQVWWPAHDQVRYEPGHEPVWTAEHGYVDPDSRVPLPTWGQALDQLDADPAAGPAHVLRFGAQVDIQGLVANTPACDRRIGYLAKYLSKSIAEGIAPDGELTARQRAHVQRLHAEVAVLPCCPQCPNWLAYGVQPKNAGPGLRPFGCRRKAHRPDRLGCGGRRVLASRRWTGKTLDGHRVDRRDIVRDTLAVLGADVPAGYSATETGPDGKPRWLWERVDPREEPVRYIEVIATLIAQRQRWRAEYERAKQATVTNSATAAWGVV